tara:strand:+ start:794 stop:1876 length:1083 start_codon:yes stop_codon:yes gene_type:complete
MKKLQNKNIDPPKKRTIQPTKKKTARKVKKTTLILHVGLPKTGTTAAQNFFYNNIDQIKNDGITYFSISENHSKPISTIFLENPEKYYMNVKEGLDTKEKVKPLATEYRNRLISEIKECQTPKFLISAENILYMTGKEYKKMINFFYLHFDSIEIIGHIRPFSSFLNSLYSQWLKRGQPINLPKLMPGYRRLLHKLFLIKLDNVDIKLYERSNFIHNSTVCDLLKTMNASKKLINLARLYEFSEYSKNISLSEKGAKFLHLANESIPIFINGKLNKERSNKLLLIAEKLSKKPNEPVRLSNATCMNLYLNQREDIDWVKSELNIDCCDLINYEGNFDPNSISYSENELKDLILKLNNFLK